MSSEEKLLQELKQLNSRLDTIERQQAAIIVALRLLSHIDKGLRVIEGMISSLRTRR